MSTDDTRNIDELRKMLLADQSALSPLDGLRLIASFMKIREQADRLKVIELAEQLAKPAK